MLNLLLTIAIQSAVPVQCDAIFANRTERVPCSCGVTAQDLKKRVCKSDYAPDAIELREVGK